MSVATIPVSVFAENAPRVAVQISMSTDVDKSGEVGPEDEITATVTWKSVLASAGEPVTIQVTNGAEILINSEEDVEFQANGKPAAIKPVTRTPNGETVSFTSGSPAASPLENKIIFKVKAPSNAGKFNLSVKIGSNTTPNNPQTNFVEEEFTVNPLRLKTTLDVIDGDESFEVYGNLTFEDPFMLAMEIRNKETGDVAFESTTMDISSDGKFSMGTFAFNDSHALGGYVVEVVLLDSNFNPIGNAKKEIEHIKTVITYHDVTIIYKDADTGETMLRHTKKFEHGTEADLMPEIMYSDYKCAGYLLNGEPVEGQSVQFTVTEPAEVVYLYHKLYNVNLVYEVDGGIRGGEYNTGRYLIGDVITLTAPDRAGCKLVGVTVNDESATLINGNQVQVTITGSMVVTYQYQSL